MFLKDVNRYFPKKNTPTAVPESAKRVLQCVLPDEIGLVTAFQHGVYCRPSAVGMATAGLATGRTFRRFSACIRWIGFEKSFHISDSNSLEDHLMADDNN